MSFNGGIELGQLAFVGAVLAAAALAAALAAGAGAASPCVPRSTRMGILAAFWCFERVATWLG